MPVLKKGSENMKVPKIFTPEREKFEKEIEEVVKNTLVDKVLVKDLARELEAYFESQDLAKRIVISFEKKIDIANDPDLNTKLEKDYSGKYCLSKDAKVSLQQQATGDITDKLRKLRPDVQEEEITHEYVNSFSILTKDVAYKLFLKVVDPYCDETSIVQEVEKKGFFGDKIKKVREVYCNIRITGDVNYAKFDKSHHETILKILKENKYLISVDVKEPKKE